MTIKEIILAFANLILSLIFVVIYSTTDNLYVYQTTGVLSLVFSLAALYQVLPKTEIKKVRNMFFDMVLGLAKKVLGTVKLVGKKLSGFFGEGSKLPGLSLEYTDEVEYIGKSQKASRKKKKRKKYKDMTPDEKVRYIYEQKTKQAIKNGAELDKSMTPRETVKNYNKDDYESVEYIEEYNKVRYK